MKRVFVLYFSALIFSSEFLFASQYSCTVSSKGFQTGIILDPALFRLQFDISRDSNQWNADSFSFESPLICFGPLSTSGPGRFLEEKRQVCIDPEEISLAAVNREGNPLSNFGVLFRSPSKRTGLAGWRLDDSSRLLFWTSPDILTSGKLSLAQSVSFRESTREIDSWYFDDVPLFSRIFTNSLVSLLFDRDSMYGGGILQISLAESDRGGMSFLTMCGVQLDDLDLSGEATWTSPGFIYADCHQSDNDFEVKTRLAWRRFPLSLKGEADLTLGPGNVSCGFSTILNYNRSLSSFSSEIKLSFERIDRDALLPSVGVECNFSRKWNSLWWSTGVEGAYDGSVFSYQISLKGGADTGDYGGESSLSLVIDRRICLNGNLEFHRITRNMTLSASFSLEELGIYNCSEGKIQPSFAIKALIRRYSPGILH